MHNNFPSGSRVIYDGTLDSMHRHFGGAVEDLDGVLHAVYRKAASHGVLSGGTLYHVTSKNGGVAWTAEQEIVAPASGYDHRGTALGCTSSGRIVLIYDKVPVAPVVDVRTFHMMHLERGETAWIDKGQIHAAPFVYGGSYGRIKRVPGGELLWTHYHQNTSGPNTYKCAVWGSVDDGDTWAPKTPIYLGSGGYTEAETAPIDALNWLAVVRSGGLSLMKTTDGGGTWSKIGDIANTDSGADAGPTIDKFKHRGRWYVIIGWCDRGANKLKFAVADAEAAMLSVDAFDAVFEQATDMENASGYQSPVANVNGELYVDGGTAYMEFREFVANQYSLVRFVRMNVFDHFCPEARASGPALPIANGEITVASPHKVAIHVLGNEGGALYDELIKINGGFQGQILILHTATSSKDTKLMDMATGGNLQLAGDQLLDHAQDFVVLVKDGALWYQASPVSHNG